MSREIKFRAWDSFYKQMISSEDIEFEKTSELFREIEDRCDNDIFVMQFTGLKDKKRQEIYEGDVLIWRCTKSGSKKEDLYIVVIDWEKHHYGLTIHSNGEKWATGKSFWNESDREIIGNIYQNPELITELNKTEK